jgi:hypothetical protein
MGKESRRNGGSRETLRRFFRRAAKKLEDTCLSRTFVDGADSAELRVQILPKSIENVPSVRISSGVRGNTFACESLRMATCTIMASSPPSFFLFFSEVGRYSSIGAYS